MKKLKAFDAYFDHFADTCELVEVEEHAIKTYGKLVKVISKIKVQRAWPMPVLLKLLLEEGEFQQGLLLADVCMKPQS